MNSRKFTQEDQKTLEPGYYWIRRCEPDGPPFWEVGRFTGTEWLLTGYQGAYQPTVHPQASNAWTIGDRVTL